MSKLITKIVCWFFYVNVVRRNSFLLAMDSDLGRRYKEKSMKAYHA